MANFTGNKWKMVKQPRFELLGAKIRARVNWSEYSDRFSLKRIVEKKKISLDDSLCLKYSALTI